MNSTEAINAIKASSRKLTDTQIEDACALLYAKPIRETTEEERMVRCCLVDVYEERHGEDGVDALLAAVGA